MPRCIHGVPFSADLEMNCPTCTPRQPKDRNGPENGELLWHGETFRSAQIELYALEETSDGPVLPLYINEFSWLLSLAAARGLAEAIRGVGHESDTEAIGQ